MEKQSKEKITPLRDRRYKWDRNGYPINHPINTAHGTSRIKPRNAIWVKRANQKICWALWLRARRYRMSQIVEATTERQLYMWEKRMRTFELVADTKGDKLYSTFLKMYAAQSKLVMMRLHSTKTLPTMQTAIQKKLALDNQSGRKLKSK